MNEGNTWKKLENVKNYEFGVADLNDKWSMTRNSDNAKYNIAKRKLLFDAVMPYFKETLCGA